MTRQSACPGAIEGPFAPAHAAAYPATAPPDQAVMKTNPSLYADIAHRIRTAAPKVQEVLLFGSNARGEARPDSDVDLVLLVPNTADHRQVLLRARKSLRGMGLGFDLLILTPTQWTDACQTGGWLAAQMAHDAVRLDVAA